jgi:hypothetical protein
MFGFILAVFQDKSWTPFALVIRLMQQKYPEFGLTGKLLAQGEDIDDRWQLYIENGEVKTRDLAIEGLCIVDLLLTKLFLFLCQV